MADLLARAAALRDDALARLEVLVSAESPSGDTVRIARIVDELHGGYEAVGARVERERGPDGDHLVCHWPGQDDTGGHVLLVGHCDTVLPAGTIDRRPFAVAGDTLTGPGVYDMKGALVAVELAMRLLVRSGMTPDVPVRLVIVNDEEIGSPDGARVVAAHTDGAVAALGLEPPLPGDRLKIGRRGVARILLTVTGVEAHAGLDASAGVSAIDELVDQLVAVRHAFDGCHGATLNAGTIAGGGQANVVAGAARAELGLRFESAASERAAFATIDALTASRNGAVLRTERLSYRPAWAPDPANPLAARLIGVAEALGLTLGTGVSGGAGDTNQLGAAGVPTVDGLGPDGSGAHGPREQASLRSLLDRAALLAAYLADPLRGDAARA